MPKADGEPWDRMDGAAADKECGVIGGFYIEWCGVCKNKVVLHCDRCQIQVSGCRCTVDETLAEQQHYDGRLAEIEREELLREQLQGRGLWIPPSA